MRQAWLLGLPWCQQSVPETKPDSAPDCSRIQHPTLLFLLLHRMLLPLDSISRATADEDILSVSFVSGQPDLLLKVCWGRKSGM
jgi:hypothetical protein